MPLLETPLPDRLYRGKVRDTYDLGDGLLLMVATDRISAFDVVLPTAIPDKGRVLSLMSKFWFDQTATSCRTISSRSRRTKISWATLPGTRCSKTSRRRSRSRRWS